jgi:hypothetical protein
MVGSVVPPDAFGGVVVVSAAGGTLPEDGTAVGVCAEALTVKIDRKKASGPNRRDAINAPTPPPRHRTAPHGGRMGRRYDVVNKSAYRAAPVSLCMGTPRWHALWHVTAKRCPAHPKPDDWFAHRQYTPTDSARA